MPRYVILEHDWPEKHWDFMLETGPVLQTWKLTDAPQPGVDIPAERSFDHRLMYLDYEGPISEGRGAVTRWDQGNFEILIEEENWQMIHVQGRRLQGTVELVKHSETGWQFMFSSSQEDLPRGHEPRR